MNYITTGHIVDAESPATVDEKQTLIGTKGGIACAMSLVFGLLADVVPVNKTIDNQRRALQTSIYRQLKGEFFPCFATH
jgi:hypothetical protein